MDEAATGGEKSPTQVIEDLSRELSGTAQKAARQSHTLMYLYDSLTGIMNESKKTTQRCAMKHLIDVIEAEM